MRKIILTLSILLGVGILKAQQNHIKDTWTIRATDIDSDNYYGVTLANGMIGLVSSASPMKVNEVVLNGVYDTYQRGRVSNILQTFNHVNMELDIDGRRVGPAQISRYEQKLDMKSATLQTRFEIGNKAAVNHEVLALRHLPYCALVNVEIEAYQDILVSPMSVMESPTHLQDIRNYYAEIDRPHVKIPLLTSVAKSPSGAHTLAASTSFIFEESHGLEPDIIHEDWDYNRHLAKFSVHLKAGETYRFSLVASTLSSLHNKDPQNEAERLTIFARLEGRERLEKRHQEAWNELWQSDIEISGAPELTRDIRFALYHLYSFAREGTAYSMSPMGLSGLGYNGHVFWDTELWMYPPLLLLQPSIARSLLDYRFERLDAARENAFAHGYQGAMFPWESAQDGSEETPVWALTGPFQHHISGDISWAHWNYYLVTGDRVWLETRGWPVIREVADFWCSRVERNGPGRFDINNVIGANEWQENIDNNAFTNAMAITSLQIARKAAMVLGLDPDPDWSLVEANIPILKFEDGVTRENATYSGEMIKQADVNLLAFPLGFYSEETQVRKDLIYYEPRMSPEGPAMGFSVLSALHARLGEPQKALALFEKAYQPNRVPPFGVLAETAGGTNPYFATGAGGMLQAILFGFGGLEISGNGIRQNPTLIPEHWKKLSIKGVGLEKKEFFVEN